MAFGNTPRAFLVVGGLIMNQDIVYVTGHRHPDTDSIASAIGYAFYKRATGTKAQACRIGNVNAETKYLLDRFGFEEPMLLEDARVRLSEITIDEALIASPDMTIYETIRLMGEHEKQICAIADEEGKLLGVITRNDIGMIALGDTASTAKLLEGVSTDCIRRAVSGRIVYDSPRNHINGRVSVIALTTKYLDIYHVKDKIIIIADDKDAQIELIRSGAGALIVTRSDKVAPEVIEVAKQHDCSIILSGHSTMNTSRYIFFAPKISRIMTENAVRFYSNELAEDVGRKMLRSRFHNYPVTDADGKVLGFVARYHIMTAKNKKIILVDHNEFSQSVRAIDKAEVLEVIDHHRINDFSTNRPVAFRNEIVGSAATIVATILRENQIPIPQNLAGLLLGALLSDTLNFQSPTTTERDRQTANILAALADLDLKQFAEELFTVTADIEGKSIAELINQDVKFFDIEGCKTMISQVIISKAERIAGISEQIQQQLDTFTRKKNLDLCVVIFSSILENGSILYASGDKAEWVEEAFPNENGENHSLQEGVLSRKSQVLPILTSVVEKYSF